MRAILLILSLVIVNPALHAFELSQPLTPFKAEYSARYSGKNLSGSRQLSVADGRWHLSSEFKTLFASISESATGSINNQLDLKVERYDYQRKVFGVKKRQSRVFDHSTKTVTFDNGKKQGSYAMPENTFDTASQQFYIREMLIRGESQFSMAMAARTNLKQLQFNVSEVAPLSLPIGTLDAIRVDRVPTSANGRKVAMWFSPSLDYQLVKLIQTEPDGKSYEIALTKVQ